MVCLIEFQKFDKILSIGDDLLDLEYKLLDEENFINMFEFQKNKWDFMEFKDLMEGNKNLCCYAIPNIIFNSSFFESIDHFSEVILIRVLQN